MSFCPQCGAPTTPGMSFCTACGRTLTPAAPAAPTPAAPHPTTPYAHAAGLPPAPPPIAAAPSRPVGKTVEPWIVILLAIVTFGIYPLFLWWRAAREVDGHAGSDALALVRPGVVIAAVGLVLNSVLGAIAVGEVFALVLADPQNPPDSTAITTMIGGHPLYPVAAFAQVVGAVLLYTGLARMWRALHDAEARLGRRDPVQAGTLAGIGYASAAATALSSILTLTSDGLGFAAAMALSGLLGFAGFALFIALLWVMYTTQKHLNELWQASAPRAAGW